MTANHATWQDFRLRARALGGDIAALEQLFRIHPRHAELDRALGPGLCLTLDAAGPPGSSLPADEALALRLRRALRSSAALWLRCQETLEQIEAALAGHDVRWSTIKGAHVALCYYDEPAARPISDLDLLVRPAHFREIRSLLRRAGFVDLHSGSAEIDYFRREGYAWQLRSADGFEVELHTRLWGLLPEHAAEAVLGHAAPKPSDGSRPGARLSPTAEHAYVLAAVHAWLDPSPRSLLPFVDLDRIVQTETRSGRLRDGELGSRIVAVADQLEAQLPVVLAADAAARLFPHATHDRVAHRLGPRLRTAERRVRQRCLLEGPDSVRTSTLVLSRLLSGRPSRSGWRSVLRRAWPHEATVRRTTPQGSPLWRRRLSSVRRSMFSELDGRPRAATSTGGSDPQRRNRIDPQEAGS